MMKASDILDWLKANPDAFRDHPEWLDHITLPHQAGTASLLERQIDRLREENRLLASRFRDLTAIAADNERLMRRLHELTLDLMARESADAFIDRLIRRLTSDFASDCVRLHLVRHEPALDEVASVSTHTGTRPDWVDQTLERGRIVCGRLTRKKMVWLFGDSAEQPGSAALVPLPDFGLLAIGAASPERFHPGMGTLFLELLGSTLHHRLAGSEPEQRKRA